MPRSSSAARWRTAACSACSAPARSSSARLRRRQRREDRVHAPGNLEVLLQPGQRHEHGAHLALLRPQRELADRGARQHPAHRDAHRAAQVVLARVQRLDGNRRGPLQPDQQRGALAGGQVGGQRGAEEGVAVGRPRHTRPSGGSARSDRPRRRRPRRRHAGRCPARSRNPAPRAAARTTRIAPRRRGRRRGPRSAPRGRTSTATTAWSVRPSRSVTSAAQAGAHRFADDERARSARPRRWPRPAPRPDWCASSGPGREGPGGGVASSGSFLAEPGATPSLHVPAQAVHTG